MGLPLLAAEQPVLSLSQNGILTLTNATLNSTCRVEWASSANGPWHGSWDGLSNIVVTNPVVQMPVPMFYRVICQMPPVATNIAGLQFMAMLAEHSTGTNTIILDVRTPSEFQTRHIKNAVNINYNASSFTSEIAKLDRNKLYLLYCGSGTRSAGAMTIMVQLGFLEIYGLSNGLNSFVGLTGASNWLTP